MRQRSCPPVASVRAIAPCDNTCASESALRAATAAFRTSTALMPTRRKIRNALATIANQVGQEKKPRPAHNLQVQTAAQTEAHRAERRHQRHGDRDSWEGRYAVASSAANHDRTRQARKQRNSKVEQTGIGVHHRCINFRHGDAGVYRWAFEKGRKSLSVAVSGPLIADDLNLVIRAALDDVGLASMDEEKAAPHLASGVLIRVLGEWCQPFPGFFLYYPSRRQQPAALSALIEVLRM